MTRLLAPYIIGAFLVACLFGGLFYAGYRYAQGAAERDAARDYITGTEDARDATNDLPDDDSGLIGWLHDFINGR